MIKKILVTTIVLTVAITLFSQEKKDTTYWAKGGDYSINVTQVSFTNWAAGGEKSISGVTALKLFAKYNKANISWENNLNLGYGLTKQDTMNIQKNEDRINLSSKLGIKASKVWFYSGSLDFESQFAPGYSDATHTRKISDLFSPAFTTLSLGMDYKPSKKFSAMLSPLTGKMTIVNDENLRQAYGVDSTSLIRMEMGAYVKASVAVDLMKNVAFISSLGLFSNYLDKPQNVDINWKVELNMKINQYLSAKINTHFIYDDDTKTPAKDSGRPVAQAQFKQLLGIGLAFKF